MKGVKKRIALKMLGVSPPPPDDDRLPSRDPNVVRNINPRPLTDEDIEGWMEAADSRPDPLWHQMDVLLEDLKRYYPVKVHAVRSDIRWLRHQAFKYGLDWGVNKKEAR